MKLYERCIGFVNIITTTIPDDQMTKIKVVGIENLSTVQAFLILITFINEKEYEFFEFEILNF
jgi:hypothetical protein